MLKNNLDEYFLAILISLFVFISYIKGTIAINYLILFLFIIILLYKYKIEQVTFPYIKPLASLRNLFLLLILWIFLQPFLFSENILLALREIKGQLMTPILFFFVGFFLINLSTKLTLQKIINIIYFTGFLHIVIIIVMALYHYFNTGYLPTRRVYLLPVDEVSFLTNLIYAMFLCEIYIRVFYKKSFLFLGNNISIGFILLLFIFSVYLQGMRFGMVTFSITSILFLLIMIVRIQIPMYKKIFINLIVLLPLVGLIYSNIKTDKRWDTLSESVQIAWNSDSLYWLNHNKYPCPRLKNGKCVNRSNYTRPAQQIHGYKLIVDFPLGVGYSRYAYQNALNKKYNGQADGGFAFPHSGTINLLIGIGIPGMILYIFLFINIFKLLIKSENSYIKFFTMFIIITFHGRTFIDMTFMNHNLKVFLFLLGLGLAGSLYSKQIKTTKSQPNVL